MIELRSDTFTLPTPRMRRAMMDAPLGDDVYGEDPTVRRLERLAATTTGTRAACLMPSGTMANLASIMAHAPRGSKILVGDESDIYVYEAGGASVCAGVVYEPVPTQPDGRLLPSDLLRCFPHDTEDPQFALPSLICVENTHNRRGGSILPLDYLRDLRRFADEHRIPVHLDGARVFNAAVGSGVDVADIVRYVDSAQFCLSKGLSAPIGSVVVGSADFVTRVRRARKLLGGGMRQAGLIAAAGIVAITEAHRLADDHTRAARLAAGLRELPGLEVLPVARPTNIVLFRVTDPRFTWQDFLRAAARHGVALSELGHGHLRAVTHSGVTDDDVDRALTAIGRIVHHDPVPSGRAP